MTYDRPYMQDSVDTGRRSPLTSLLVALVAVFVLQNVFLKWLNSAWMDTMFSLSWAGVMQGRLWQPLSYGFLHDTNNILHLLLNGIMLYFLGASLLPLLGGRRFTGIFLAATLMGGLSWLAAHAGRPGQVMGASGAVFGLFSLFCALNWNRPITFLLFFIIPVTMKPKVMMWVVGGITLMGLLFSEIPGGAHATGIAHSAHAGGMLAGLLAHRILFHHGGIWSGLRPRVEMPEWLQKRRRARSPAPSFRINLQPGDNLRSEVDRILDKINASGFGALTPEEKRTLDQARDMLGRR